MGVVRAEQLLIREVEIAGWTVRISSFRLGGSWHATIESVDVGARFARGEGVTREEAEASALERAGERLGRTRKFPA